MIVAGMGLAAKVDGVEMNAGWFIAKIGVWLLLGASVVLIKRKPGLCTVWWWLIVALGGTAGYLVWMRPF